MAESTSNKVNHINILMFEREKKQVDSLDDLLNLDPTTIFSIDNFQDIETEPLTLGDLNRYNLIIIEPVLHERFDILSYNVQVQISDPVAADPNLTILRDRSKRYAGIELVQKIRAAGYSGAILFHTIAEQGTIQAALNAAHTELALGEKDNLHYFTKSHNPIDLIAQIRRLAGLDDIAPTTITYEKEKKYKLLYVEDEKPLAKMLPLILKRSGIDFEVEIATDFQEAIAALKGEKNPNAEGNYSGLEQYAAIITDMSFPGGNGAIVAKEARKLGFDKRIVIASGQDMEQAKRETNELKNIGYLNKPFKVQNLLPALEGKYSD